MQLSSRRIPAAGTGVHTHVGPFTCPEPHRSRLILLLLVLSAAALTLHAQQSGSLPDAPLPQEVSFSDPAPPGGQNSFPPEIHSTAPGSSLSGIARNPLPSPRPCSIDSCSSLPQRNACCEQYLDPFQRYLQATGNHPLTPWQKLHLAGRDVIDPFNLLTIVGSSALTIATDSSSAYGPGFEGFGKLTGVSFSQDLTAEFFGTFLIPSIARQDPHFHRMPNASLKRRIAHCFTQVVWTQSDTGRGMFNYATIFGTVADEGVSNMYVPYRQVGWGPAAQRITTAWATDPIGNVITEFLPDVARHININVVFVQRIINRVAVEEGGTGTP
ncbi:hypothetical protein [Paracidobacterium acidisoli]|uniref:Uncharacterized protein n=1 Tax=Paracidobacterium acidisoli TaxID=2303751 RepID=A0A372IMS7_9BACT|nr:hypothetical protein [Paracidobacterium acidisoli]MBT9331662.1 hypothetical protein [Paracidobacterium acidisoli]